MGLACLLGRSELLLERLEARLEIGNRLLQLGQALEDGRRLQPVAVRDGGVARDEGVRLDRVRDAGLGGRDTPSPTSRCPATPTCPASTTRSPTVELPAIPTCAHSSVSRPTRTPWATCTRLSIFVPGPIARLADGRPVDRRVGPDLHVVLDNHGAGLRDLLVRAVRPLREPEPVAADRPRRPAPPLDSPRATRSRIETCACSRQSSPRVAPRPIVTCGRITVRAPIVTSGPTETNGPIDTSSPRRAEASTAARECTPGPAGGSGFRRPTARANDKYGVSLRSIAQGAGGASSDRITAEARVVCRARV